MSTIKKHWVLIAVVLVVGWYLYTAYGTSSLSSTSSTDTSS